LGILALSAAIPGPCQQVKVAQGAEPAQEMKWVKLTISSLTSYVKANGGGNFAPSLTVLCEAQGKPGKEDRTLGLLLDTGGVAPGTMSTRASGEVVLSAPKETPALFGRETLLLPMKLDSHQQKRTWELLPKSDSVYAYMGAGETGLGALLSATELVEKLFGTSVLAIDFQPFSHADVFESKFLTGGLKKEFQQHRECSLR
jgi:hypothetical protein